MPRVDAGVEQRDRDARPSAPGSSTSDPPAARRPEGVRVERGAGDGGRIRGAHRVDARHDRVALERGEQRRVDRRREAVQDADVRLLGVDRRAARPRAPRSRAAAPACAAAVHARICSSVARPPARADAVGERRRAEDDDPAAPELRQRAAAEQPLPALRRPTGASAAPARRRPPRARAQPRASAATRALDRRVRIERKVAGQLERTGEPGRGGDHRRVVGAERERREPRVGQRRAQLRVRRDAADDRDRPVARLLGGRAKPADERPHDRPLVRGGEVGPPRVELVLAEARARRRAARS